MKKMFSLILALALILTIMPMPGMHDHAHAAVCTNVWHDSRLESGEICPGCDAHAHKIDPNTGRCVSYGEEYSEGICNEYDASWDFGVCEKGCACAHSWKTSAWPKRTYCEYCDHDKGTVTPVVHAWEYSHSVKATCMHGGYESYMCLGKTCKTELHYEHRDETLIDPNAHNFVNGFCVNQNEDKTETCTAHQCKWENGVCVRVAGCTEKHAHTDANFKLDVDSVVDPTCNSFGGYDLVCDECGEVKHVDGTAYDSTNHSWNPDGTCANGCGEECEHKTYVDNKCAVCGCPNHEHPGEAFTDKPETPATCVKGATWTRTYACGATETITGDVDPNAHSWAPDGSGKCVNDGCDIACPHEEWVEGKCTACTYECPHTETTQNITLDATCTNVGSADMICDECGEVAETVELPIDEDAHDWIVFSFGAGYCRLCGEIETDDSVFEDDEPTVEPTDKPTCPDNAHEWVEFSFGGMYCYKCGATTNDINPIEPERCDHSDTYLETVEAATCSTEGTAKEICDICETVLDENVVLPIDPDAHDWIVFSFGAGFCRLCSHISVDDSLFEEPEDPMDSCEHDWIQVTNSGWFCPNCGGITTDEDVVNPPVEEPEETTKPTCPNNAHEWVEFSFGGMYCIKCGATTNDIKPIEPERCDHSDTYIDVITPATCKEPGVGNKMCDICETLLEENVEVPVDTENGHKWTTDAEGNEYCELCGENAPVVEPEEPCEHEWIEYSFGAWFCIHCGEITLDDPNARVPGDANDDGEFSLADILLCKQKTSGWNVEINESNADVNADGVFGLADILIMEQKTSGWDVTLL